MIQNPTPLAFTLVETMVAVALLAVTIILPYTAIQKSLIATYIARDELISSALAQEAVEYVRAVRDSNYLYNLEHPNLQRSWLFGFDGTGGGIGHVNCFVTQSSPNRKCTVDPAHRSSQVSVCTGDCKLYLLGNGRYTHAPGIANQAEETKFKRYIQLRQINAREVEITATVEYENHGNHKVIVTDILNDWL